MSVPPSLAGRLPADVLLHILHLLSYNDILSMRKVRLPMQFSGETHFKTPFGRLVAPWLRLAGNEAYG